MPTITVGNWSKTITAMNGNGRTSASTSSFSNEQQGDSLVDPSWELIDPTPDVHAMFLQFNDRFFDGALAGCEVRWSPRMTTCAGICCYEGRGGLCSIRLSQPLLTLRPRKDLVETLLHEMIHAFLFVKENNRDHDGHGPQFQAHMHRINQIAHTKITIYHSFHAEVALYKQHWWRCQGPCRERKPYYGWVKRASNRAPGPNDLWWKDHERTCGGAYVKVKEPEGYENGKKVKTTKKKDMVENKKVGKEDQPKNGKQRTLMEIFGGTAHVLGAAGGAGSSQLPSTTTLPVSSPHPTSRSPTKANDIVPKRQLTLFGGVGHVLGSGIPSKSSGGTLTSHPPTAKKPVGHLLGSSGSSKSSKGPLTSGAPIAKKPKVENSSTPASSASVPPAAKKPKLEISSTSIPPASVPPAAKKPKIEISSTSISSATVSPTGDFAFVTCPACSGQFFQMDINTHLDLCLSAS